MKYFTPNGNAPLHGQLVAYSAGVILAFLLAVVYNFIAGVIPFVYFNVLITSGYSIALAFTIKSISKIGLQRNYKERLQLCIALCILSVAFHWAAHVNLLLFGFENALNVSSIINILITPSLFLEVIGALYEKGAWSIFGVTFKGWPLLIIWIIETVMIFLGPIRLCQTHLLSPYSNLLDKWYRKLTLNNFFEPISLVKQFESDFEREGINAILNLKFGLATRYSEISIFYLPGETKQYLSISSIYVGHNGGTSKSETILFHLIEIDTISAELLMKKYGTKRNFFLDY